MRVSDPVNQKGTSALTVLVLPCQALVAASPVRIQVFYPSACSRSDERRQQILSLRRMKLNPHVGMSCFYRSEVTQALGLLATDAVRGDESRDPCRSLYP